MAWLLGLAVVFRVAGSAARQTDIGLARPLGWLLCAVAAWLAGAAAGGFAPIGAALAVGLLFALLDHHDIRWPAVALGDVSLVLACAWLSIPRLSAFATVGVVAGVVAGGGMIERFVASTSPRLRSVLVTLPVLLWVGHTLAFPEARDEFERDSWPQVRAAMGPFFALARADVGRPVVLETGSIAWLTLPSGPPPHRPALFFHGADGDGAYQRGGLFLRRALVSLGFAVLAVDERGFGGSPPPTDLYELESWDPEPTALAAARYLDSLPEVEGSVFALGHSMGATRVLRFIDQWPGASAGAILGATVMPPAEEDERLYGRFLNDFDVEESGLTPEFVLSVRRSYFNNDAAAGALFDGHPPILFLRFTFDYENIIAGREELFEMIPGSKVSWELRSDHQFASSRVAGMLGGDWRILRRLQVGLGRFIDGRDPATGDPMRFAPRR